MVASDDLTGIGKLVIGSAYFPHDSAYHPPEKVRSLVDYCKVTGLPLLLGCDANSHHKLWGSTDTNRRGENVVDYSITTDLDIIITGTILRVSDEPSLSDQGSLSQGVHGEEYYLPCCGD